MNNEQLSKTVQEATQEKGLKGVMDLTELSPLSYERTRKVWHGVKSAKISDYVDVMGALGYELKFVKRGVSAPTGGDA